MLNKAVNQYFEFHGLDEGCRYFVEYAIKKRKLIKSKITISTS